MLITSIITIILVQQNLQVSCSCWTSFFLMIAQNFVMENNFSIHSTFGGHSLCFLFFFFWSQESTLQPSYIYPFALLFSHSVMSDSLRPHVLQHTRLPCSSPSPRAYSNSCPLSQWCHPNISSCHPLLLLLSIFPDSGSFLMSRLFTSGGQSTGASALASNVPMNIQHWFHLGLTDLISNQTLNLYFFFPYFETDSQERNS